MDGGPFRTAARPAGRQVAALGRTETPNSHADEPETEPVKKAVHHTSRQQVVLEPEKTVMRFVWPVITLIIVAIVGFGSWYAGQNLSGSHAVAPVVDTGKYQAVFFTNGQVYFGKLHAGTGDYLKLTDIYYLQNQSNSGDASNPQKAGNDQNSVQLIKLGNEIHGPEDEMMIAKDQVLFYENLKTNSKVAESIQKYKDTNK